MAVPTRKWGGNNTTYQSEEMQGNLFGTGGGITSRIKIIYDFSFSVNPFTQIY